MNRRRVAVGAVLSCLLATGAATAATAAPTDQAAAQRPVAGQPYLHLVTTEFGTGGAYVTTGRPIELRLDRPARAVEVFAEGCDSPDLGAPVVYPAGVRTTHTLGSDVPGTCFVVLLRWVDPGPSEPVRGRLSY